MSQLIIERTFLAPRTAVWSAFSDPAALAAWWGPIGWNVEVVDLDFRVGGRFVYRMSLPDGRAMYGRFAYDAIEPVSRIVYRSAFSDAEGGVTRAPFAEAFPLEVSNELTFSEVEGRTVLRLVGAPMAPAPGEAEFFEGMFDSMRQGYGGTLDQLEAYVAEGRVMETQRHIHAAPERIWAALQDPDGFTHWWGPQGFQTTTHAMDFREGGEWRFTMHGPDGKDYANRVVYRHIDPPRFVSYHHADPDGHLSFEASIRITPENDGSLVRLRIVMHTAEQLREVESFGAREGGVDTLSRLATHVGG